MTQNPIFKGAATALITPMNANGVDYENFGRLIDWQIEQGISALVVAATTGECCTLSTEEHHEVLEFAIERAAGRAVMIAGSGSNDTQSALSMTRFACGLGYDAMLVVTPYYNKTTQNGLIRTYNAIADASTKPLILYNVPSRTGVNIEPATYAELAKHPNIKGIKEANNNIAKIVETMSLIGDKMDLYSGNDDQICPLLSVGGAGVISVLSNLLPAKTQEICSRWFAGDTEGSLKLQFELFPLVKALFSEVNPVPAKAAMARMGFGENYVRLPLVPMEEAHAKVLYALMEEQGL